MILTVTWFIAGLAALIAGAELLVRGSSRLASLFGISKLVIGLTVVAFGTSAPELAVSIQAGMNGQPDIMLGNILGSNITNILLVLGISALIMPLQVNRNLIKTDLPVMIGVTVLLFIFSLNGLISFTESLVLVIILAIYLVYLARNRQVGALPGKEKSVKIHSKSFSLLYAATGLILLILGAGWLIDSAVLFAEAAGVSELVIGLTIVAIGTSLPEITTSIVAAMRRERELVISNIIGSNILNILAVLGITGLILPESIPVSASLIRFDMLVLLAASFACLPVFFTGHLISRWEGALFSGYYVAYMAYLWLSSGSYEAIPVFSNAMLFFVLPITAVTLLTITVREWRKRKSVWQSIRKG